jgi:hypothetical protein
MGRKQQIVEWESRWYVPAGVATLLAIALLIGGAVISRPISGDDRAEVLEAAADHGSALILSGIVQAIGFALLAIPLMLLFRAAAARSDRVRPQLIGLVIAAPIFFALATGLNGPGTKAAADEFIAGDAVPAKSQSEVADECREDRQEQGSKEFAEEEEPAKGQTPTAACEEDRIENSAASEAIANQTLTNVSNGFAIGGRLGLAFALLYTCLWAMRTGLLTRFWGSLGMALGVAALLGLVLFLALWFIYFAFLALGRVPGGRPPAWAAGEAIPWPTPGERAAAEMEPADPDAIDVDAYDAEDEPPPNGNGSGGGGGDGEKRKRKRR